MSIRSTRKNQRGFTMLELLIAVSVMLVLSGIIAPLVTNTVNNVKVRYSAFDLSGLCQKTRIDAARKNTHYTIATDTLTSSQVTGYFADENGTGTYASGEPLIEMANQVNLHIGSGSGAPSESTFITSLGYSSGSTTTMPSFNARGLPCVVSGSGTSATCPQVAGQGFVYFLSRSGLFGTTWAAVAITPSGHVKVYGYDGTSWLEQ
jgi:type IV fimbrial biogenesis protein FimT